MCKFDPFLFYGVSLVGDGKTEEANVVPPH
jgi:hypothetical protein